MSNNFELHPGEVVLSSVQAYRGSSRGRLVLTAARVMWAERDTVLQVRISDIQSHFLTKPGSKKVKVRLLTKLASTPKLTFEFISKDNAYEEATFFVDTLAQIRGQLSISGDVSGPNAEIRAAVLRRNPQLLAQHRELVSNGTLTDDEFWVTHAVELRAESLRAEHQSVGMSSQMLSDLRPTAQSTSTVNFTLTPQAISHIFHLHPHVKKAYDAAVPAKMTQEEFWKSYIQSSRVKSGSSEGLALFSNDEEDVAGPASTSTSTAAAAAAIDLTGDSNKRKRGRYSAVDIGADDEVDKPPPRKRHRSNHSKLIRMYNRHSTLVLGPTEPDGTRDEEHARYLSRLHEATLIPDLVSENKDDTIPLVLQGHMGGMAVDSYENESTTTVDVGSLTDALAAYAITDTPKQPAKPRLVSHHDNLSILMYANTLCATTTSTSQAAVPPAVTKALAKLELTANELLRQFWVIAVKRPGSVAAASINNVARRVLSRLGSLQQDLRNLRDDYLDSETVGALIDPLIARIQKAKARFEQEQARQSRASSRASSRTPESSSQPLPV